MTLYNINKLRAEYVTSFTKCPWPSVKLIFFLTKKIDYIFLSELTWFALPNKEPLWIGSATWNIQFPIYYIIHKLRRTFVEGALSAVLHPKLESRISFSNDVELDFFPSDACSVQSDISMICQNPIPVCSKRFYLFMLVVLQLLFLINNVYELFYFTALFDGIAVDLFKLWKCGVGRTHLFIPFVCCQICHRHSAVNNHK